MFWGPRLLSLDFKQATNLRKDTSFQWFFNKKARTSGVFDPRTGIGTLHIKKVKTEKQFVGFGDHTNLQKIIIDLVLNSLHVFWVMPTK